MEYCHEAGIPYSEFLEWSAFDQEAEISYMVYRGTRCPNCGTFPEDWLDEKGEHIEPTPYVPKSVACLGCETLEETRAQIPDNRRQSIIVYLAPREVGKSGLHRPDRRQGGDVG